MWLKGHRKGKGIQSWPNGDFYSGNFENGMYPLRIKEGPTTPMLPKSGIRLQF